MTTLLARLLFCGLWFVASLAAQARCVVAPDTAPSTLRVAGDAALVAVHVSQAYDARYLQAWRRRSRQGGQGQGHPAHLSA